MYNLVITKMVECEECGKRLGIFDGYQHPTLGKNHQVCSLCFDQVEESVAKWRDFILTNSNNIRTSQNNLNLNWKKIIPNYGKIKVTSNELW